MASAPSRAAWHPFAWQGIQFDVPGAWELGGADGDARKGYCRLDDGETTRLEARWETAAPGAKPAGLVDRFLAGLFKKIKDPPRVQRDTRLVRLAGFDTETFSWHDRVDSIGLCAVCAECGRASLIRLINPGEDSFRAVAVRILNSFRDHACDGMVPWAVLDFRFAVPEGWSLLRHSLRAGRLELEFGAKKNVTAQAVRVGLAEIVLRDRSLEDWLKSDPAGGFGRARLEIREIQVGGHRAADVSTHGRRRLRRLFITPNPLRCRAWSCGNTNAIYVARWTGPARALPDWERFASSFQCHSDASAQGG